MTDKITKKYTVEISVDPKKARGWKNGMMDWDAYPNWNINYEGEEESFIEMLIEDLQKHNQYSGITIEVEELKGEKVNA